MKKIIVILSLACLTLLPFLLHGCGDVFEDATTTTLASTTTSSSTSTSTTTVPEQTTTTTTIAETTTTTSAATTTTAAATTTTTALTTTTTTTTSTTTTTTTSTTTTTLLLMGGAMQGNALNLSGAVTTFAGTAGQVGTTDATGAAAKFYNPDGITTDGTNLFITDANNKTIRKVVISSGVVTTLAGSAGSSGSTDGTGTAAKFNFPRGITTDGTNLFVADTTNHTIRKIVISSGVVTTLAGSAGQTGEADGTGTAARFYDPVDITTDGTNLFVADTTNYTIRKIVISSGVVTTLAGSAGSSGSTDGTGTAARFKGPYGIVTDGANLYATELSNPTIRKIVISSGVVTTFAGSAGSSGSTDGTGTAARFYFPRGITSDGTNLYVCDQLNNTIRKIVISSGVVTTLAGSAGSSGSTDGTGTAARFYQPWGITTDGTNPYVSDSANNIIRKIQ